LILPSKQPAEAQFSIGPGEELLELFFSGWDPVMQT